MKYPRVETKNIHGSPDETDQNIGFELKNHVCSSERGRCFHCWMVGSLCHLYYEKGGTIKNWVKK